MYSKSNVQNVNKCLTEILIMIKCICIIRGVVYFDIFSNIIYIITCKFWLNLYLCKHKIGKKVFNSKLEFCREGVLYPQIG